MSRVLLAVPWILAWTPWLPAATVADSAVFNVIKRADSALVNQKILYRNLVAPGLDLVIAMGSPAEFGLDAPVVWWGEKQKLGLFLQEEAGPEMVYSLALLPGFLDCEARIERATSTDTVISCIGEKAYQRPNQKFVYDVRAKALVSHFEYQPVSMIRIFNGSGNDSGAKSGGAVFVGSDMKRLVAIEFKPGRPPEFRILDDAEAAPWLGRVKTAQEWVGTGRNPILYILPDDTTPVHFGPSGAFTLTKKQGIMDNGGREYPLPQSTFDDFAKSRPQRMKNNYVRENTIIEEAIGPVQTEGDQLWFGKTFYDGEGNSGVGGFGYFDALDRQYHLFAPPEIADCSISAIRVEPDAVWLGIVQFGEYGGSPRGVLRYDRKTQTIRKYELPDAVYGFSISGNRVLVATNSGIAVIEGDQVKRYFVDRTTDGDLRIADAVR